MGRQTGAASSPFRTFLQLLLLGTLFMIAFMVWRDGGFGRARLLNPDALPRVIAPRGDLAEDEKTTIELFRNVAPSVVYVTTITTVSQRRDFFHFNLFEIPEGTGSGFIWDDEGHIVTNAHVVANSRGPDSRLVVTLANHSTWEAELVGLSEDSDLAVLKIESAASPFRPILVGSSDDLVVGQKVFAIGNPFGLDQTLTTGIISGLGREIRSPSRHLIKGVIQTDAAINPGNSGGPLLDSAGRLIGVNTAIVSPSGSFSGIGFAIPVDTVNDTVTQLIRYGRIARPGLGVSILSDNVARAFNIRGVVVMDVVEGSGASEAGILPATPDEFGGFHVDGIRDIIVGVQGRPVSRSSDLFDVLDLHEVGDTLTLSIQRGSRVLEIPITLGEIQGN